MDKTPLDEICGLLKKASDDYRALAQQIEAGELDNAADYRQRADLCYRAIATLKQKGSLLVPRELVATDAALDGDYLRVPQGMTPVYAHTLSGRMLVYVEGWTPEKEYDVNRYDVYRLSAAESDVRHVKIDGVDFEQEWYMNFGSPVKIAMKQPDGEFLMRDL